MTKSSMILTRYWSLAAAVLIPVVELFTERFTHHFVDYEIMRAVLSVVCIALLVHSWFMQRRYARSRWRLAFLTLLLSLISLGPLWLGLNVIRSYSYEFAADYSRYSTVWYHNLYWHVVELQDVIVFLAKIFVIVAVIWVLVDIVRWLAKRIRARE